MSEQFPLETILANHGRERDNLIPLLQEVQERFHFLSPEAVQAVADHLELSENDVYGVATFYAQFRFVPPGLHHIKVCEGTACHVRGSDRILDAISRSTGLEPGQTSDDGALQPGAGGLFRLLRPGPGGGGGRQGLWPDDRRQNQQAH